MCRNPVLHTCPRPVVCKIRARYTCAHFGRSIPSTMFHVIGAECRANRLAPLTILVFVGAIIYSGVTWRLAILPNNSDVVGRAFKVPAIPRHRFQLGKSRSAGAFDDRWLAKAEYQWKRLYERKARSGISSKMCVEELTKMRLCMLQENQGSSFSILETEKHFYPDAVWFCVWNQFQNHLVAKTWQSPSLHFSYRLLRNSGLH